MHFFTVDVEEYFQVSAFDRTISREQWPALPSRLEASVELLLELLARHEVTGTFFTLGWVAERLPHVVRAIVDAGHEIASHGYWHHRVPTLTPAQFRADVRASKSALEDLTGQGVIGYRAPSFSIVAGAEWALDVLIEEGFVYDSSLFPVRRPGYGYPRAGRDPHILQRVAGVLCEFPPATLDVAGVRVPAAGGGYLRHFPFGVVRRAFLDATNRGVPATFYVHPWEVDPEQPRLRTSRLTALRHYRGLKQTAARIERLLGEFTFGSIGRSLAQRVESGRTAVTAGHQ
ncbi:MAG TPA: XrtA system polysaccharide deacetylase [Gemmatimonadaceae bacterium]|nr:XrtA system polysaccharide deacetylase [Gemmatimonadaceae bacterium]